MVSTLRQAANTLLLSLFVATPSLAQRPARSADSIKAASARRLLELNKTAEMLLMGMESGLQEQRVAHPDVPDEYWDAFIAHARARIPPILDSLVPVYASRFTQAELDELIRFYASPVGNHLVAAQPAILRESRELGNRWADVIGREVRDSLIKAGGATGDVALSAQMRSDLRNLVIAEEAFFADSVKYTTTIGVGGLDYHPSGDNKILTLRLTNDGWVATLGNARTKAVCAIFVGATPIAPATQEGEPRCQE